MLRIDVKSDIGEATKFFGELTQLKRIAASYAMNRVITQVQTQAAKSLREKYSFKASTVKSTMSIIRANDNRLEATLRSRGRRTRLIDMSARQTRIGVSVKVGRQRKVIPHAFIATMKSGHTGVFIRTTKKSLPIKELYTIAIPEAFGSSEVVTAMRRKVDEAFLPRFEHELRRLANSRLGRMVR